MLSWFSLVDWCDVFIRIPTHSEDSDCKLWAVPRLANLHGTVTIPHSWSKFSNPLFLYESIEEKVILQGNTVLKTLQLDHGFLGSRDSRSFVNGFNLEFRKCR